MRFSHSVAPLTKIIKPTCKNLGVFSNSQIKLPDFWPLLYAKRNGPTGLSGLIQTWEVQVLQKNYKSTKMICFLLIVWLGVDFFFFLNN